jgi:hypothetical protein
VDGGNTSLFPFTVQTLKNKQHSTHTHFIIRENHHIYKKTMAVQTSRSTTHRLVNDKRCIQHNMCVWGSASILCIAISNELHNIDDLLLLQKGGAFVSSCGRIQTAMHQEKHTRVRISNVSSIIIIIMMMMICINVESIGPSMHCISTHETRPFFYSAC